MRFVHCFTPESWKPSVPGPPVVHRVLQCSLDPELGTGHHAPPLQMSHTPYISLCVPICIHICICIFLKGPNDWIHGPLGFSKLEREAEAQFSRHHCFVNGYPCSGSSYVVYGIMF